MLLFTAPGSRRVLWWTVAALGIAGMAWSRTYLQVHWLSDVVAGSLLGVGVSLLVFGGAQRSAARPCEAPGTSMQDSSSPASTPQVAPVGERRGDAGGSDDHG